MRKYRLLLISFLITSCCGLHTEVRYNFNDITITRIDECGETSFYFQKGDKMEKGRIFTKYSGINDGFNAELKFGIKGKVTILVGDGYFKCEGMDTTKFSHKYILAHESPELRDSVCYIALSTRYEIEQNAASKTKVKLEYIIDDNEWW